MRRFLVTAGVVLVAGCSMGKGDGTKKVTAALTVPVPPVTQFVILASRTASFADRTAVTGGHLGVAASGGTTPNTLSAGFDTHIGRKAGTLLGQEVRDWCMRATAAGLVGYYIPAIVVQHLIPRERLTKRYFRRWFYWRGISRAMMYARSGRDMEAPEQSQLDFSHVAHVAGVPRYLYRSAVVAVRDAVTATMRRDRVTSFERELWLWMFAGIIAQRWKDRAQLPPAHAPMHTTTSALTERR